jgi:peptidoglycan/LPS O-acetylase OafA/YrhL
MGALRLFLALLVATAHLAAVVPGVPAALSSQAIPAVRIFFVLSGFYMALVLSQRYRQPWSFYASRMLKLLPIYWLVSALTAVIVATTPIGEETLPYFQLLAGWRRIDLADFPIFADAYALGTLVTLFGSDTWMWLGFSPVTEALSLAPSYAPKVATGLSFTAVPQAWTLGLELCFYLLAPFLVRLRTMWLTVLIAASIGLRVYLQLGTPYDRSLFPLELPLFLTGMVIFRWLPALALSTTRFKRLDAELGALSYPAYISHLLVFAVLDRMTMLAAPWWQVLPIGCRREADRSTARLFWSATACGR